MKKLIVLLLVLCLLCSVAAIGASPADVSLLSYDDALARLGSISL